jgi:hypothetical protein
VQTAAWDVEHATGGRELAVVGRNANGLVNEPDQDQENNEGNEQQ